jgi:hypothetical protein
VCGQKGLHQIQSERGSNHLSTHTDDTHIVMFDAPPSGKDIAATVKTQQTISSMNLAVHLVLVVFSCGGLFGGAQKGALSVALDEMRCQPSVGQRTDESSARRHTQL